MGALSTQFIQSDKLDYLPSSNYRGSNRDFKFIDLFAGLGGFHSGLSRLGGECIFAAELDDYLRDLYEKNYGITPSGDIRLVNERDVPNHDVLCAGFPCQPFSRAGKKKGTECPESGKLIDDVLRIVRDKKPTYIMLENVPDIMVVQSGLFWNYIVTSLNSEGYTVDYRVYTPQDFGIPQKRKRVFVVASRIGLEYFSWPKPTGIAPALEKILENSPANVRHLEKRKEEVLDLWCDFLRETKAYTSMPIIAAEFGSTYSYLSEIKSIDEAKTMKGKFGQSMRMCNSIEDIKNSLPRYAQDGIGLVSPRVAEAITVSREIYSKHSEFLDVWKESIREAPLSWQKLEWQGDRDNPKIWEHLIQFRASGIRIIRPSSAPSLVAMSTTQTPIIGRLKRYMSIREAAALQSLDKLQFLPETNSRAYRALGNAVNAHIVKEIANNLIV